MKSLGCGGRESSVWKSAILRNSTDDLYGLCYFRITAYILLVQILYCKLEVKDLVHDHRIGQGQSHCKNSGSQKSVKICALSFTQVLHADPTVISPKLQTNPEERVDMGGSHVETSMLPQLWEPVAYLFPELAIARAGFRPGDMYCSSKSDNLSAG